MWRKALGRESVDAVIDVGCTIAEPEIFAALVRYIEQAEIGPVLAKTYELRDIADAQRDFLAKRHLGKIVLTP